VNPGSQILARAQPGIRRARSQERLLEAIVGIRGTNRCHEKAEYVVAVLIEKSLEGRQPHT